MQDKLATLAGSALARDTYGEFGNLYIARKNHPGDDNFLRGKARHADRLRCRLSHRWFETYPGSGLLLRLE